MIDVLERAEKLALPLLDDTDGWTGVDIVYHPPRVERLWRPLELDGIGYRLYLHVIHPCAPGAALFHPHTWPSAMRVFTGRYEMAVARGTGDTPPERPSLLDVDVRGGTVFRYAMTHPDDWHYVRPIGGPAATLMVTGPPWKRWAPRSDKPLPPLSPERRAEMFAMFRGFLTTTG